METSGDPVGVILNPTVLAEKKKTNRGPDGRYWIFTGFNYEKYEDKFKEQMENKKCIYIYGKEICPTTGKPHLQGYLESPIKIRPLEAFKTTDIHWKKRRGTREDAVKYCIKDGQITSKGIKYRKPLRLITELRPWQVKAEELLNREYDERRIWWIYDPVGDIGKTKFLKYYKNKYDADTCILASCTGPNHVAYIIKSHEELTGDYPEKIIIDLPAKSRVNLHLLEEIKNGLIHCPKFESCTLNFNCPNVMVLSNELPDRDLNGRIKIKRIKVE